jgi:hypothetical protein
MISNNDLKEILDRIENDRDYLLGNILVYMRFELKEVKCWTKKDFSEKIKDPFTSNYILRNKRILRYLEIKGNDCLLFESNKQGSLSNTQIYRIFYEIGTTTKALRKKFYNDCINRHADVFILEILAKLSKKTLYEMFRFAEINIK